MFFTGLTILSSFTNAIPLSRTTLSCDSMDNQPCKARAEIINVNNNNPIFYPFSIKTSKCCGDCNSINDTYEKICVPDVVKDLNVTVFNLISWTNETKNIKWYETCKCECRLDAVICIDNQRWNKDKCRCECKELIDKGVCDKDVIWNPSNCECECNKACDFSEYLDYKNCTCKRRLVDKLVEECNETIDEEVKIIDNNKNKCNSCILYIIPFSVFLQLMLELVLILLNINTWFVLKKMFLDMIIFIKQQFAKLIKWEK